jgi:hypothetical protein
MNDVVTPEDAVTAALFAHMEDEGGSGWTARDAARIALFIVDQRRSEAITALQSQLAEARALMEKFCVRVERGEVRSKRTYLEFKTALKDQSQ